MPTPGPWIQGPDYTWTTTTRFAGPRLNISTEYYDLGSHTFAEVAAAVNGEVDALEPPPVDGTALNNFGALISALVNWDESGVSNPPIDLTIDLAHDEVSNWFVGQFGAWVLGSYYVNNVEPLLTEPPGVVGREYEGEFGVCTSADWQATATQFPFADTTTPAYFTLAVARADTDDDLSWPQRLFHQQAISGPTSDFPVSVTVAADEMTTDGRFIIVPAVRKQIPAHIESTDPDYEWVPLAVEEHTLGRSVQLTGTETTFTITPPRHRYLFDSVPAKPILRVYPRTDGRGASTTQRVYPQDRAQQASNRVSGNTYL